MQVLVRVVVIIVIIMYVLVLLLVLSVLLYAAYIAVNGLRRTRLVCISACCVCASDGPEYKLNRISVVTVMPNSVNLCFAVTDSRVVKFLTFFPRCMECQRGLAIRKMSVCPSVRQTRGL